jgi:broad specificity phosphatase PhoE
VSAVFYLVRHAAHDNVGSFLAGRTPGIRLGPDGLAQAERLGRRMTLERFDAIYASPRERTQETAAAIAAPGAVPVSIAPELDEVDFGEWSGSSFEQLNKLEGWQRWNAMRSMNQTPAGETMLDVQHRAMGLIRRLLAQRADGRQVLVSHADVIKSVVSYVLGLPLDSWPRLEIAPASISTVIIGPWGGKLVGLNETIS